MLLRGLAPQASIIVVGLQEVPRPGRGWKEALLSALPPRWSVISGSRYMGMRVVVLAADGVRTLVEPLRIMRMGSGVGDRWPNKGAVAVVLRIGRTTRCCFVVAHLAAQEGKKNLKKRESDYVKIIRRLENEDTAHASANVPLFLRYEYVFVLGDLNYRIVPPTAKDASLAERVEWVEDRVAVSDWPGLAAYDELVQERAASKVFVNYHEGPLRFPPTFKFEPGLGTYTRNRVPSYCDRILWHSLPARRPMISQVAYTSVPAVKSSDHLPVRAVFDLKIPRDEERPSLRSTNAKRIVLEFTAVRYKKGTRRRARVQNGSASRALPATGSGDQSRSDGIRPLDLGTSGFIVEDDDSSLSSCSSSSSSSNESVAESSSGDDSCSLSSDELFDSDGEFLEDDAAFFDARGSSPSNPNLVTPRVGRNGRDRRSSSFDDATGQRFNFGGSLVGSDAGDNNDSLYTSPYRSRGVADDPSSSEEEQPLSSPMAGRGSARYSRRCGAMQPPRHPRLSHRFSEFASLDGMGVGQRERGWPEDGNRGPDSGSRSVAPNTALPENDTVSRILSRHLRSSSGPSALRHCYSGDGGLTTDGKDEPIKRDSLSQSLSQIEMRMKLAEERSRRGRKKPRLKSCLLMDVHGPSVFLKPKRVYRAELRKRKDGSRSRSGIALPAIPLYPVDDIKELMHEHVQISFWRARTKIGTCGVLPLADVVNHALVEGGSRGKYSFELQLTKYGLPVSTLEASVRLVVSDSNLWVDGDRRVVHGDGRYRGNLPVRKKKTNESLSSKAARTAQSARAAKSVVAHRMDSLGSERGESPAGRR